MFKMSKLYLKVGLTLVGLKDSAVPPVASSWRCHGSVQRVLYERVQLVVDELEVVHSTTPLKYSIVKRGGHSVQDHVTGEERDELGADGRKQKQISKR